MFPIMYVAFLSLQVTRGVILDSASQPRHCCYGDKTYQHGQVVMSRQRVCMQLVCQNGKVSRQYLGGKPGPRNCCEFDGELYFESAQLTSHCATLQCRDSCWHPFSTTTANCCRKCSVQDYLHFRTFDSHPYDFHGVCNYSLAQRGNAQNPEVGVFSDFTRCYGKASCLSQTTFKDNPHTVVTMSNGALFDVQVNGHPFHVAPGKVHALRSEENCHPVLAWRSPFESPSPTCLALFGSSRILVYHCQNYLTIIAHPTHTDRLDGLCGHFDFHVDNDFTNRNGHIHPLEHLPLAFPSSWMTNDQSNAFCRVPCRDCLLQSAKDPCTATPEQRKQYYNRCYEKLHSIFKDFPNLDSYIDNCALDLCIMESYRRTEEIDNWIERVVAIVEMDSYINTTEENGVRLATMPTVTSITTESMTVKPHQVIPTD